MKNTGLKTGIYKVTTTEEVVVFVGSTTSTLKQLKWNHENDNPLDSENAERFRQDLRKFGHGWTFDWENTPAVRTPEQITKQLEKAITKYEPYFNL